MVYNVRDFGAVGNGIALDHDAIQKALDECSRAGGGRVVVPSGTYLCGTIHLRSHVGLYLETGAVILAVDNENYYPEICQTPYGNLPGQIQALLWADKIDNFSLMGTGIVDGGQNKSLKGDEAAEIKFRPALVFCQDSTNLKFTDVTLRYASFWTLHMLRCTDVMIRGITILANKGRINTDGIDPDGCRNVTISDCTIITGDDSIAIKSTEGDLTENITVTNCVLYSSHAAFKLGTEAVGNVRNIVFSNSVIRGNVGLALYMKDGSTYENIIISNVIMEVTNNFPLILDVTPRYYTNPLPGIIRNITFDNIVVTGRGRFYVEGALDSPITNVTFNNITWTINGPCKIVTAEKPAGARRVELDPARVNYAVEPYQFIMLHAKDVAVRGLKLYDQTGVELQKRGLFYIAGCENITISGVPGAAKQESNHCMENIKCEISQGVKINGETVSSG